jgi:hypothetical protein
MLAALKIKAATIEGSRMECFFLLLNTIHYTEPANNGVATT